MKIKEYLDSNGFRYNFKAAQWGITPPYLNDLMLGKSYPSLKMALKLEIFTDGKVTCWDWIDPKDLPEGAVEYIKSKEKSQDQKPK